MAKTTRVSGNLKVTLSFNDRTDQYQARVCTIKGPKKCESVLVGAPRSLKRAVDHPKSYTDAAQAAISFSRLGDEAGERIRFPRRKARPLAGAKKHEPHSSCRSRCCPSCTWQPPKKSKAERERMEKLETAYRKKYGYLSGASDHATGDDFRRWETKAEAMTIFELESASRNAFTAAQAMDSFNPERAGRYMDELSVYQNMLRRHRGAGGRRKGEGRRRR